jgi:hypothetical protein
MSRWTPALRSLAAAGALAAGIAAAEDPAPAEVTPPIIVPHAAEPLVIDGKLDEPIWQQCAPTEAIHPINMKKAPKAPTSLVTTRLAWDEHYLYIGYEWHDTNINALPDADIQGPPTNKRVNAMVYHESIPVDLVEFFVACSSRKHYWELHHNALNTFNDIQITMLDKDDPARDTDRGRWGILFGNQEYLRDDQQYTFAMAVQLMAREDGKPSTINVATDTDTGYTAELRLPWFDLLAPWSRREKDPERTGKPMPWHMAGHDIRMLVVAQNPDFPGRGYYHSAPTFEGGWFHNGYDAWLVYRMGEPAKAE